MEIHNKSEAKTIVVKYVKAPVERKELIAKCVKHLGLSEEILKDKRPGGTLNKMKCLFGLAITELINSGVLVEKENILSYKDPDGSDSIKVEKVKRDIRIEKILFDVLKEGKIGKSELLDKIAKIYNDTEEEEKISTLKADGGRLLSSAVKSGKVIKDDDNLYLLFEEPVSESPEEKNKRLFEELGDEELVDKTVLMLEQWYRNVAGYDDLKSANIDGPDDGGIDGIIKGSDKMGASEKIIMQIKRINKKGKFVPLCEIREFYGVFATESDATKALFVTNSKYYKDTKAFANKTKYFTLIDGEKWLELAKQCGFELKDEEEE